MLHVQVIIYWGIYWITLRLLQEIEIKNWLSGADEINLKNKLIIDDIHVERERALKFKLNILIRRIKGRKWQIRRIKKIGSRPLRRKIIIRNWIRSIIN